MQAKLVLVSGRASQKEVPLKLPMSVGRGKDQRLAILHPTVSRRHCELFERGGMVWVRDVGSANGTFIGEKKITESVLKPGERLTVGPLVFEAVYESANGAATKPERPIESKGKPPAEVPTVIGETQVESPAPKKVAPPPEAIAAAEAIAAPPKSDELPAIDDEPGIGDELDLNLDDLAPPVDDGADVAVSAPRESNDAKADILAPRDDLALGDALDLDPGSSELDLDLDSEFPLDDAPADDNLGLDEPPASDSELAASAAPEAGGALDSSTPVPSLTDEADDFLLPLDLDEGRPVGFDPTEDVAELQELEVESEPPLIAGEAESSFSLGDDLDLKLDEPQEMGTAPELVDSEMAASEAETLASAPGDEIDLLLEMDELSSDDSADELKIGDDAASPGHIAEVEEPPAAMVVEKLAPEEPLSLGEPDLSPSANDDLPLLAPSPDADSGFDLLDNLEDETTSARTTDEGELHEVARSIETAAEMDSLSHPASPAEDSLANDTDFLSRDDESEPLARLDEVSEPLALLEEESEPPAFADATAPVEAVVEPPFDEESKSEPGAAEGDGSLVDLGSLEASKNSDFIPFVLDDLAEADLSAPAIENDAPSGLGEPAADIFAESDSGMGVSTNGGESEVDELEPLDLEPRNVEPLELGSLDEDEAPKEEAESRPTLPAKPVEDADQLAMEMLGMDEAASLAPPPGERPVLRIAQFEDSEESQGRSSSPEEALEAIEGFEPAPFDPEEEDSLLLLEPDAAETPPEEPVFELDEAIEASKPQRLEPAVEPAKPAETESRAKRGLFGFLGRGKKEKPAAAETAESVVAKLEAGSEPAMQSEPTTGSEPSAEIEELVLEEDEPASTAPEDDFELMLEEGEPLLVDDGSSPGALELDDESLSLLDTSAADEGGEALMLEDDVEPTKVEANESASTTAQAESADKKRSWWPFGKRKGSSEEGAMSPKRAKRRLPDKAASATEPELEAPGSLEGADDLELDLTDPPAADEFAANGAGAVEAASLEDVAPRGGNQPVGKEFSDAELDEFLKDL